MKKLTNGLMATLCTLALFVTTNSCKKPSVTPDPTPTPTPKFLSFSTSADTGWYRAVIVFNWSVDATSVDIFNGSTKILSNGPVTGSYTTGPLEANTSYTIVAKNGDLTTSKPVNITIRSVKISYLGTGTLNMISNKYVRTDFPSVVYDGVMDTNAYTYYANNRGKITFLGGTTSGFDWYSQNNDTEINIAGGLGNLYHIDTLIAGKLQISRIQADAFNPSITYKDTQIYVIK